ncbi:hypothetical protein GGR55DRAFT_653298 [Xylaria sp. FL0064]|nr:hypothetical protein GGR55DRAFT_653298 [Xylaria sp. FL0064]
MICLGLYAQTCISCVAIIAKGLRVCSGVPGTPRRLSVAYLSVCRLFFRRGTPSNPVPCFLSWLHILVASDAGCPLWLICSGSVLWCLRVEFELHPSAQHKAERRESMPICGVLCAAFLIGFFFRTVRYGVCRNGRRVDWLIRASTSPCITHDSVIVIAGICTGVVGVSVSVSVQVYMGVCMSQAHRYLCTSNLPGKR